MRGKGCAGASTIHRLIYKVEIFGCPEHPWVEQSHDAECCSCQLADAAAAVQPEPGQRPGWR